ncbi:uncharacterized protein B0H64DRAFT_120256 [Chaetomium fimeti]|uniref:Uncharacterized protein n=1 Tax=Chaetomium fimeti TaxID=1854472 RepID=A0AAE0HJ70_9PEZI|nr:hypothetical protein B0H64DRAFT_120256 [Chaetomium fimeti]
MAARMEREREWCNMDVGSEVSCRNILPLSLSFPHVSSVCCHLVRVAIGARHGMYECSLAPPFAWIKTTNSHISDSSIPSSSSIAPRPGRGVDPSSSSQKSPTGRYKFEIFPTPTMIVSHHTRSCLSPSTSSAPSSQRTMNSLRQPNITAELRLYQLDRALYSPLPSLSPPNNNDAPLDTDIFSTPDHDQRAGIPPNRDDLARAAPPSKGPAVAADKETILILLVLLVLLRLLPAAIPVVLTPAPAPVSTHAPA